MPAAIDSIERIYLSAREIEAIVKVDQIDFEWRIAAAAFSDGISAVRLIVVVRADWARQELEASLELIARTVFDEIELVAARGSLDFWRAQGAETGRQAAEVKRELRMEREAGNRLNEAVSTARLARPNERFARFGELVANGAGFDRWTVGIEDGGLLIVAASSSGCEQFDLAGAESALAENFRRRIKMLSASCVCIPFETGVIALVSRHANASAAKAEAMVERLAPFAASWAVERHAARRGTLARQLALRMFAAIDEERTRIARDLHDDQAQLLAAAKIALKGNPEAARAIFKQIEDELRHKTRELRPATLGATPLDEAIGRELARLKRAGVKATLIGGAAADKISRPVQQLCFQVVREALSNVIRHARAKSVKIAIEKVGGAARVSISDDGCGVDAVDGNGIGLAGVREPTRVDGRYVDGGVAAGQDHNRRRNSGVPLMEDHKRIRVLIADDHRIFREALRMLLAAECVVIAEASDGEEAVAKAAQLKPQVVVMDLGMRGIGGLLAARRITRADPSCRVLALSQYDDEEYVLEALGEAGCAGYVVKTDAAAELLCAVRAVNSGRRYLSPTIAPIVLARMRNGGKANASRAAEPTPREREVLKLIGEGASTKEVALRLGISVKTAQVHRDNLKQKLDCARRRRWCDMRSSIN